MQNSAAIRLDRPEALVLLANIAAKTVVLGRRVVRAKRPIGGHVQNPSMRINKTDERARRWKRLKDATGESTVSGALDVAAKHYIEDLRAKQEVAEELDPEVREALSSTYLPIEVDVDVGRDDGDLD